MKNNSITVMTKEMKAAYLIGVFSIVINSLFGLSKIIIGLILNYTYHIDNSTLIADGIHSFTDVVTSIVAVASLKIISRPRDSKYNYGYERYSSLASVIVSSIFLTIGLSVIVESLHPILESGHSEEGQLTYMMLVVSSTIIALNILMKIVMFFLIYISGKRIKNDAMKLESFHQFVDSLSSVISILSLLLTFYLGTYPQYVEFILTLVIVGMIFFVSIETLIKGINELSDKSINKKELDKIKAFLEQRFSEVKFTMIKTRSFSNKFYMDLELDVDCEMNIHSATYLASLVKKELLENFDSLKDINITFKPIVTEDTYNCSCLEEHDINNLIKDDKSKTQN